MNQSTTIIKLLIGVGIALILFSVFVLEPSTNRITIPAQLPEPYEPDRLFTFEKNQYFPYLLCDED